MIEIQQCPIIKPTWKEFQNFREFVERLDKEWKPHYGMVKVVPPPQWKPRNTSIEPILKNLTISSPIQQNAFGKGGIYQCLHIPKKSLSYEQYKQRALQYDKITDKMNADEIQSMFWKNIAFSPPLYGADLLNTLMQDCAGAWNLNSLDSVLNDSIDSKVKGVNSPYCYVGSWKALFCWHTQDLDLSAINYVHYGKSKFWYAIHKDDKNILEKQAKMLFPQQFSKCSQFLRHKTLLINPNYLKKKYPNLRIVKTQHKQNEFVLVFGGSYHTGFNFGFNIAEAVNYGTIQWLEQIMNAKSCTCSKSSVRASITEIQKNLSKTNIRKTKQFKTFQKAVQEKLEQQQKKYEQQSQDQYENLENRRIVKSALSKQIKKLKKIPKTLTYNNQQYQIEHWAQCQKCKMWRVLSKPIGKDQKFFCHDAGKKCKRAQKISKNVLTL